jgi:hypothetical protein
VPNQPLTWIELTFGRHAFGFHHRDDAVDRRAIEGRHVLAEIDGHVGLAIALIRREGAAGHGGEDPVGDGGQSLAMAARVGSSSRNRRTSVCAAGRSACTARRSLRRRRRPARSARCDRTIRRDVR